MIGISAIGSYIPAQFESNLERQEQFGIDDAFLKNKIGVLCKARKGDDEETSDLCCRAFAALAAKTGLHAGDVDCLVVCTQNPDGHGLPHTAAVVHGKLGCSDNVAAFDISLGCSGYVYGLAVVTAFMQANGLQKGVFFTADPYSKIVDRDDKNTALLFGDAATATLLDASPRLAVRRALFGTRGSEGPALEHTGDHLFMNGRAVFDFSMTAAPPQLQRAVQEAGWQMEEVDLFLLHQGSRFIVDQMTRRLKLPPERVPSNLAQVGNTVSSSIPLLLESYLEAEEVHKIVACGFGVGLSWASAALERVA